MVVRASKLVQLRFLGFQTSFTKTHFSPKTFIRFWRTLYQNDLWNKLYHLMVNWYSSQNVTVRVWVSKNRASFGLTKIGHYNGYIFILSKISLFQIHHPTHTSSPTPCGHHTNHGYKLSQHLHIQSITYKHTYNHDFMLNIHLTTKLTTNHHKLKIILRVHELHTFLEALTLLTKACSPWEALI